MFLHLSFAVILIVYYMVTMLTFTNSVDIPEPVESSIWREQETICHFSTPSTSALSPSLQLDLGM